MQNIRNIAIIAHVDHGKTTLVDKMLLAGHLFRENQNAGELILDNNDLERERGITILQKAIQMGLKPVVVVNKVDKPNCRPDEVNEMVFDLMFNLDATEDQLDFPTIYGSAKQNWMSADWREPKEDITAVLDAIIDNIPAPTQLEGDPQMLITSLDFSNCGTYRSGTRAQRHNPRRAGTRSLQERRHSDAPAGQRTPHVRRHGAQEGSGSVKRRHLRHCRSRQLRDRRHPHSF